MQPDLIHRHRIVVRAVRSYARADEAWRAQAEAARRWFPRELRPAVPPIGDPGSPLRRLWEERERALHRLIVARRKLVVERERVEAHRTRLPALRVLLLADARG